MEISTCKIDSFDEVFDSQYLQFMKQFLKLIGLWPYESIGKKILHRCLFLFFMFSATLPMVNGIKTYYGEDTDSLFECVIETIFDVEFIILYIYCMWLESKEKIRKMIDSIAENWILIKIDSERRILEDYCTRGRKKSLLMGAFTILASIVVILMPVTTVLVTSLVLDRTEERTMAIKGDYFLDQHDYYYQISIVYTIIAILNSVCITCFSTLFIMTLDQNVAIFKIVRHRIIEAVKLNDDNESYRHLVQAARLHQRALQFAALNEDACSTLCIGLLGVTVVFMSCSAACVTSSTNFHELLKFMTLGAVGFVQLFILSWPGQQFINYSTDVYTCVYDCDWYLSSKRNKKIFQIMMLRSLKPSVLTAGGLYVLNYENCLAVLKASLSYVAVIRTMREELN